MDRDIRKNIVDESGKNSDNIVDIEAFAAEYEADEEFENLIKNGLDESWDDLGLSVSDDLIARTMNAIKNADESAKAFPAEDKPAQEPAPVKVRKFNYRRIARIAAGIAAAALIGIVGIGVLKNGLFMKKSADATMAPASNGSSMTMNAEMAASDTKTKDSSYSKSDASAATANSAGANDMYPALEQFIEDSKEADNGGDFSVDSMLSASAGSFYENGEIDSVTADASDDDMCAAEGSDHEPVPTAAMTVGDNAKFSDITQDFEGVEGADGGRAGGNILDITSFGYTDEEQYNKVKTYIESVRGDLLGTGTDSDYLDSEHDILYQASWPETEGDSVGLVTVCDIYQDRMVFLEFSMLGHLEPSHEVEEYALEDGEAVAKELRRLLGDEE